MRWRRRQRSGDVVDRRGVPSLGSVLPRGVAVGGGVGIPSLLILVVVILLNGLGPGGVDGSLDDLDNPTDQAGTSLEGTDADARLVQFTNFVVTDAQDFWSETFSHSGRSYRRARLVLFEGATQSGCGGASASIGPHYCPVDENIYLDLDFFKQLRTRFKAPGDFAQAYVIAHEVAHHVQKLMGISGQVNEEQRLNPDEANELSVRLELQADCLAGVWAFTTYERQLLESGDVQEGLRAAASVGDDRIQQGSTGRIDPESWTHGSSEQRVRWFQTGFENGDPNDCDTFNAEVL
jgi:predicted metalloprotease